jgi:hypothetical protein
VESLSEGSQPKAEIGNWKSQELAKQSRLALFLHPAIGGELA